MMSKLKNNNYILGCLISLVIPITVMIILYIVGGFAPFGDISRVWTAGDGNYQYYDFYCYLKDIMTGEQTIGYSFNKGLGGNMWAVISYYLSSPFNLLLFLFTKQQLDSFLGIVFILKYATISLFTYVFLYKRFEKRVVSDSLRKNAFMIILSVSFALSYYSLHQTLNYMWLDGVYMLPLILLGTYNVVEKKKGLLLSVAIGLSLIFNWYIGALNCIFSVLWLFLELFIKSIDEKDNWINNIKKSLLSMVKYAISMLIGIGISCFSFLPTVAALQNGNRGSLDLSNLLDLSLRGYKTSLISGTAIGAQIGELDDGKICLYCGTFVLIGFIGFFLSTRIGLGKKIVALLFTLFYALSFFWNPLFMVFSLLKYAKSWWCRYSYGAIFFIIFISAYYFLQSDDEGGKKWDNYVPFVSAGAYIGLLIICSCYLEKIINYNIIITCVVAAVLASLYAVLLLPQKNEIAMRCITVVISLLVAVELSYSSYLLMIEYKGGDTKEYSDYVTSQESAISSIKGKDRGKYRINQTYNRLVHENGITANYNEGLAFNYMPVSSYTSSPDDVQRTFLDNAGYRISGPNTYVVNTSILALDSFLGVKYLMSKYPIEGYQLYDDIDESKKIYYNPYALPMALTYENTDNLIESNGNPFEYQNQLYSKLMGGEIKLFRSVQSSKEGSGKETIFNVNVPEGNYALYGNIPYNTENYGIIYADDVLITGYADWLTPSVFYIPHDNKTTVQIKALSENNMDFIDGAEQFYVLDIDELGRVSDILKKRSVNINKLEDGEINITANMEESGDMLLTVPYDSGWKILVNGVETDPELFADTFYSFKLNKGENTIEMTYKIGNLKRGIAISIVAIMALIALALFERRRQVKAKQ